METKQDDSKKFVDKQSKPVLPGVEGGSPDSGTRLDCSNIIGTKEKKGPFLRQIGKDIEQVRYSFHKAIVCGDFIEFHEPELPYILGRKVSTGSTEHPKEKEVKDEKYVRKNIKRSKDMIKRLIIGNFTEETKLLTLTFNNENDFDITDISECNKKFSTEGSKTKCITLR